MCCSVLQGHTATEQWQSFEMRMRRRRVERCLIRASVAIEVGVLEDAREAIDEIRRLQPDEPGLEQLTADLAEAENRPSIEPELPPETVSEPAPARHHRSAAAVVLLAGAAAGGWWWTSTLKTADVIQMAVSATRSANQPLTKPGPDPFEGVAENSAPPSISTQAGPDAVPLATVGLAPLADPQPAVSAATQTETAPDAPVANVTIPTVDQIPVQATPVSARSDERPALSESRSPVVPPVVDPAPVVPVQPASSAKLEPLTDIPGTATAPPRVVAATAAPAAPAAAAGAGGAEGIAAPEAAVRSTEAPAVLPSPPPADTAPTRSEEQRVRATLARYEAAYNRLDAAAAASVWPGVNQRALASAFHGLSAQAISLGDCEIRVTGATANAQCTGTARWTPKVGGGTQSAARQWRFDLRNSAGNWVITQAIAR
jgi:hypothetical protein